MCLRVDRARKRKLISVENAALLIYLYFVLEILQVTADDDWT